MFSFIILSDNTLSYIVLIAILSIENSFKYHESTEVAVLTSLDNEHKNLCIQLLLHILTDFINSFNQYESMQSSLLVPILTGLFYLFTNPSLLSFTWNTSSVYPISISSFFKTVRSFINTASQIEWSSFSFTNIKLLSSYNTTAFPYTITHIFSICSLQPMRVQFFFYSSFHRKNYYLTILLSHHSLKMFFSYVPLIYKLNYLHLIVQLMMKMNMIL